MSFFSQVSVWHISENAFRASLEEMARDGQMGNEGVALWLGQRGKGNAEISHIVALRGELAQKHPQQLVIEPALLNDVTDLAIKLGLVLVGQIHSHGPYVGTDLSTTDRAYGLHVPYYLSVVAPDYAQRAGTTIGDCGVHVFLPSAGYTRLSTSEVAKNVRIRPGGDPQILFVGDN